MSNFNLRRSAVWSVAEVATSGIALFFLYKYVVAILGLHALGVWSLVLATTSLARLGDLGAAAGLSRFVASALADKEKANARDFVETALFTNLAIYAAATLALAAPLWIGISLLVPSDSVAEARLLLPYALVSFALLNANAVLISGLIGAQRADLKSKISMISVAIQLTSVVALVPSFGLIGLGLGQIAQYLFSIVISWLCLRTALGKEVVSWLPRRFNWPSFHQLFHFGIKLQLANLISFSFEPATKFVISAVCGLEMLGIFEMAFLLILQARHLVVAPMQALLPAFAHLNRENSKELAGLYEQALAKSVLLAGPVLLSAGILSPIVSSFWLGSYNQNFVAFAGLLSVGWLINALGTPAYHLGVARGLVRWNIVGHVITSVCGPLFGYFFGQLLGPIALVSCISVGLALGAITSMLLNCHASSVSAFTSIDAVANSFKTEFRTMARIVQAQLRFVLPRT